MAQQSRGSDEEAATAQKAAASGLSVFKPPGTAGLLNNSEALPALKATLNIP